MLRFIDLTMNNPNGYRGVLFMFMNYRDSCVYDAGHVFSRERLGEVTANDVLDWFNVKAFGTTTPTDDDRPVHARSSSLYHWKKALSHYMPNRNHPWNEL